MDVGEMTEDEAKAELRRLQKQWAYLAKDWLLCKGWSLINIRNSAT